MGKHREGYFNDRRRAFGIVPRGDEVLCNAKVVARGKELAMLMQLPTLSWPMNLYGGGKTAPEDACAWDGCNKPHHNNYSLRPERNPYGNGFQAIKYCCSDGCRTLYYRKRAD